MAHSTKSGIIFYPNCSAKIEKDVGELNGVRASSINLMKQTLTIESDASADFLLLGIT